MRPPGKTLDCGPSHTFASAVFKVVKIDEDVGSGEEGGSVSRLGRGVSLFRARAQLRYTTRSLVESTKKNMARVSMSEVRETYTSLC
jgi:hypothetical protein